MVDGRAGQAVLLVVGIVGVVGLVVFGLCLRLWYRPSGLQVVMVQGQAMIGGGGERAYAMVGDVLPVGGDINADRQAALRFMDGDELRLELIGRGRMQRQDVRTSVLHDGTLMVQALDGAWSCVVPWAEVSVEGSAAISVVDQQALVVVHDGSTRIDFDGRQEMLGPGGCCWVDENGVVLLPQVREQWDFAQADQVPAQAIGVVRAWHEASISASDGGEWWVHGHADDEQPALVRWPVPDDVAVRSIAWRLRQMECSADGRWLIAVEDHAGRHHRVDGGGPDVRGRAHIGHASWDGEVAAVLLGLEQGSAILVLEHVLLLGTDDG